MSSVPAATSKLSALDSARKLIAHPLAHGAALSVLVQGFWVASQLATSILLAHALGPTNFGIYSFTWSVVTLLQFLPQNGLATAAVRFSATYRSTEPRDLAAGLWRRVSQAALAYGALTAAIVGSLALVGWVPHREAISPDAFLYATPALVIFPLLAVVGATLRGAHPGIAGQLPENVITPFLLLCFVGFTVMVGQASQLNPAFVLLLQAAAIVAAVKTGMALLARHSTITRHGETKPAFENRLWFSAMLPLSIMGGLTVLNNQASTLLIGGLASAVDVAQFRIAFQGASLVAVALIAANLFLAPRIAELYSTRQLPALQRLLTVSANSTTIVALASVLVFWSLGRWLLGTLFGASYAAAYPMLMILSLGQLINVGLGSAGMVLNMTGHERDSLYSVAMAGIANIALNLILIPLWGGIGAAVATAASMATWKVAMVAFLRHRTGLMCLPLFPDRAASLT